MLPSPPAQPAQRFRDAIAVTIATAGGAGFAPIAPGTAGTVVAVPIAWLAASWGWPLYLGLVAVITLVGIWAAAVADRRWRTHDSGRIVIDEVAGYLATVAFVDRADPSILAIGFVVFRALDIVKPPPMRWIDERVPGGAGVVLDDVAAGVIGALAMIALGEAGALR